MSTYTDLHNKIKETLNVDYKTRNTNQEVHFKNERNEYWGTLKGTIAVEDATISVSRIIDPFIEGGIIRNTKLSSDLFGVIDLGQVQTELESMSSFVGEVSRQLADEASARIADDKYLSSAIASSQTCMTEIVEQLEELSCAISAETIARDEAISTVSSYIIEELDNLSVRIDELSSAVSSLNGIMELSVEDLQKLIVYNDNDISTLSGEVSAISSAICLSANEISGHLTDLSSEMSAISSYLEKEISSVSFSLDELSGNVKDISANYEQRLLSAETTAAGVSAFIDNHYKQSFVSIDREDEHITTDNLVLTDLSASQTAPHVHLKYYITFENGTIALKPIK